MKLVVQMDKFGRVLLPSKVRREINSDRFFAEVKHGTVVLKPVPNLEQLIGSVPEINLSKYWKQHKEDKGKYE